MEHNDYFFYLVVALSVVGAIVKALKKKPVEDQTVTPKNVGGEILKKILEEIREKDDYIPRNPVPVPAAKPVARQPVNSPSVKKSATDFMRKGNVEKGYDVPETKFRHSDSTSSIQHQPFEPVEEYSDSFMATIDLSAPDEMKKAIIYSEIFRTKF